MQMKPLLLILKWMIKVIVAFVSIFYIKELAIIGVFGILALGIFYFEIRRDIRELK